MRLLQTRRTVEAAFGRPLDNLFVSFEPQPLASGSIAQVGLRGRAAALLASLASPSSAYTDEHQLACSLLKWQPGRQWSVIVAGSACLLPLLLTSVRSAPPPCRCTAPACWWMDGCSRWRSRWAPHPPWCCRTAVSRLEL